MGILGKTFSFHGRATRLEFLAFTLLTLCLMLVPPLLAIAIASAHPMDVLSSPTLQVALPVSVVLASVIIILSACRRLRDLGRSPLWVLLLFFPVVNTLTTLCLLCFKGRLEPVGRLAQPGQA